MNVFQFFIICKRTNNANNATHYMKLGKKRRERSKRNYYIISPRVIIKAVIIIRIRSLTEKYAVLESSQHGFQDSRSVQLVIQKECWLLQQAMKQDTKFIRVDLDFKNAFNSAGHSSLWKMLEGFGVPDVSLLSSIYEHSTMRIQVGNKSSAAIQLDTGTKGSSAAAAHFQGGPAENSRPREPAVRLC